MALWNKNYATLEEVRNNKPSRDFDLLPKKMTPEKEVWESLGFVFTDRENDVMYNATLPEGWSEIQQIPDNIFIIYDKEMNERAIYYYYPSKKEAEMKMLPRFDIEFDIEQDIICMDFTNKVWVKDSRKNSIVYDAGIGCNAEFHKLKEKATKWLNTNYPEWRDPSKYWD